MIFLLKLSKGTEFVLNTLLNSGHSAYCVGGAVRDLVMGKNPSDFDVTTSAEPDSVKALFKKTVDTGIKHGTVTVLVDNEPIEVTTFRADGEYKDFRKPESVTLVKDVKYDLARRDFTINTLCYNHTEGLIDLFGGVNDLDNKIIRAIGNPEKRFTEDALRILRAVRFSAQLGFEIEKETLDAIRKCAHLIKRLSVERIISEIDKILMSDSPSHLKLLYDLGVLELIMPEMCKCFNQPQNIKWHIYDVGMHSVNVIKNSPKKLYLRYAALMHDWGKPYCLGKNDEGEDTFRNHSSISVDLAENFLSYYRFSNDNKNKILRLIKFHDLEILPEKKYVKRAVNKVGDDLFLDLCLLKRADCLSQNLELTACRLPYIDELEKLYYEIKENNEALSVKDLKINGHDIKSLGYEGKKIGEILKYLSDYIIENPEDNEKEKLIEIIKVKN